MFWKKRRLEEEALKIQEIKELKELMLEYQRLALKIPNSGNIARRHYTEMNYYKVLHENTNSKKHLTKYEEAKRNFENLFDYNPTTLQAYNPRENKQK